MPITGPLHLPAVMDEYAARYMGPEYSQDAVSSGEEARRCYKVNKRYRFDSFLLK